MTANRTGMPVKRSEPYEPFVWLLFSGGGMVAALVLPVLIFLFGLAFPLGWISPPDYDHLLAVLRFPLTRLGLLAVCALALAHWAHRFRYTLRDGLQLQRYDGPISALCYGGALVGSAAAAYLLIFAL
jgi:fumarate reductase subunit D